VHGNLILRCVHGNLICNDIDASLANYYDHNNGYEAHGYPCTSPVGDYPVNAYGLYDMSGNVWEWCQDWYHSDDYDGLVVDGVTDADGTDDGVDNDGVGEAVTDPWGPVSGSLRVSRGGCWLGNAIILRSAFRSRYTPGYSDNDLGFRPSQGQGVPPASQ